MYYYVSIIIIPLVRRDSLHNYKLLTRTLVCTLVVMHMNKYYIDNGRVICRQQIN